MDSIKIIHEPKSGEPFIVLQKPAGLPSAPLAFDDENCALYEAIKLFPQIKNVQGKNKIEHGLLHRLDTATRGLLLIATEQEFYEHILRAQDNGAFIKTYFAECERAADNAQKLKGFPVAPPSMPAMSSGIEIVSYFRAYGKGRKEVRPVLENSNIAALKKIGAKKLYTTRIISSEKTAGQEKITCSITQGFRHQVRCHLAWCGFPVIGDVLYNYDFRAGIERASMPNCFANSNSIESMQFYATGLEFPDLYSGRVFKFEMLD